MKILYALRRFVPVFTLGLALASCSKEPAAPAGAPQLVVGFSQIGAESEWRARETESIQKEAAKRGIELKFADAQGRQENQIKALKSFVAQGVDAILLAPQTKLGWDNALLEVQRAGIPVVLVDRGIETKDESLYATLIASDFVEEGRVIGRWLAEKTGGTCNVVELAGTVGSDPAIERAKGFAEAIAAFPGIRVLKSQPAEFTRAKGKEVMEAFLKAEGDAIQAVYAHNDDMALGALQALEEAGKKPGVDVLVLGIDAAKPAFTELVAGKLNALVECSPLLGPLAFDAVEKVLRGESVPKRTLVPDRLFDASNAAEELSKREY
ncbi:MAG: ABC transporter substrate-binding protein [Planctomycetes bacterium]|nr:ABC transporter substrate-binding protein [Planctomycetota bacterium]